MADIDKNYRLKCLQKWMNMPGKLSVASIPNAELRENLAVLLENQASYSPDMLNEDITTTQNFGSNNGDGARFQPISLALVRRGYYEHFAHKVVGFQAMSGPVGLAYAWRKIYDIPGMPGSSTFSGGSDQYELAFRALNEYSGYTGSNAQSGYAASAVNGWYNFSASATAGKFGEGAALSAAEAWKVGTTMPSIRTFLDKVAIEAKTRKLASQFSLEAAQDLKAMQNLDIERELLESLSVEIPSERDREIIGRMIQAALNPANGGVASVATLSADTSDGRWSQEKYANVTNAIVKLSHDIATATLKGAGNFVIVSPRVATALQASGPQFTAITVDVNASTTVAEVGRINGSITVYRDNLAPVDYALVGYKGPSISDTGIVVSDYVTGLTNRAIDPTTFGVNIGVMSRYAITDSLLGSGRYYRVLKIVNLDKVMGI